MLREHLCLDNQSNPGTRFAQFFQTDAELVHEIGPAFSSATLLIIRGRRGAAAHELATNVTAHSRVWQRVNNFPHSCGKINQPFNQLIGSHESVLLTI